MFSHQNTATSYTKPRLCRAKINRGAFGELFRQSPLISDGYKSPKSRSNEAYFFSLIFFQQNGTQVVSVCRLVIVYTDFSCKIQIHRAHRDGRHRCQHPLQQLSSASSPKLIQLSAFGRKFQTKIFPPRQSRTKAECVCEKKSCRRLVGCEANERMAGFVFVWKWDPINSCSHFCWFSRLLLARARIKTTHRCSLDRLCHNSTGDFARKLEKMQLKSDYVSIASHEKTHFTHFTWTLITLCPAFRGLYP